MKRLKLNFIIVAGLSGALLAFSASREGGIQGKVNPAEGAAQVLAISGRDTLHATVNSGSFVFSKVKAQNYTIMVKANPPYKDTSIENVAVVDSATTDVGEIKLLQ
ncbi:carboxypeptidase regulatory-like domain-containing protein [Pedobacter gandavensis]|uniref:carboxypeptidase regulatory-like domain-containing protein n=1 Tax=Pedobacter gandavensis TaxID=2679963 RepID=UPI002931294A|nr:carboxypeptidase regulatory-like domain-containing protein [Pedobacter gandavensis]